MKFEDFIREGKVKIATKNEGLIKSLIKTSGDDLKFIKHLEINKLSARKIMSNYYDILRAVLEALSLSKGYKIYSHDAFSYFLEFIDEKNFAIKFDRLRKIRNGINYYGEEISVDEVRDNVEKIEILINQLKKKYFKNLILKDDR